MAAGVSVLGVPEECVTAAAAETGAWAWDAAGASVTIGTRAAAMAKPRRRRIVEVVRIMGRHSTAVTSAGVRSGGAEPGQILARTRHDRYGDNFWSPHMDGVS